MAHPELAASLFRVSDQLVRMRGQSLVNLRPFKVCLNIGMSSPLLFFLSLVPFSSLLNPLPLKPLHPVIQYP